MLIPKTISGVFTTVVLFSCMINSAIGANTVRNVVHARDGRSHPNDVTDIIRSNHLEKFCSSWLGGNGLAKTITTTATEVKKQYTTVTVGKVSTATRGSTTVTTTTTATQGPGTMVTVKTSYVTDTVTRLSTGISVVTSHTLVGTETVTTTVATGTVTSNAGTVTSTETATSVITSTTTSTTTITPTFTAPPATVTVARRDSGPAKRGRRGKVPDCLEHAPDSAISTGCSRAYPPKTVVQTVTVYTTSIKGTQTTTAFTSTTTVPGKTRTVTSTTTTTNANPTVTTIITTNSTIFGTVSATSTTLIPSTLTETVSTTLTTTVLSTSTLLTTTTVTTSTTSTAPVATYTACPGQNRTPGAFGIGVNAGDGTLDVQQISTAEECCLRCYNSATSPRCSAWVYSAPNFCGIAQNAAGPNPNPTCPNGLGNYFLLLGGNPDPMVEVGGPGPCAGNQL